jgi:hypothetical protein
VVGSSISVGSVGWVGGLDDWGGEWCVVGGSVGWVGSGEWGSNWGGKTVWGGNDGAGASDEG